jgi:hypothetical protein
MTGKAKDLILNPANNNPTRSLTISAIASVDDPFSLQDRRDFKASIRATYRANNTHISFEMSEKEMKAEIGIKKEW